MGPFGTDDSLLAQGVVAVSGDFRFRVVMMTVSVVVAVLLHGPRRADVTPLSPAGPRLHAAEERDLQKQQVPATTPSGL